MPFRYIDANSVVQLGNQVGYGPTADLAPAQGGQLHNHYGTARVLNRINQYSAQHATYVNAAQQTGRNLTIQETQAQAQGHNVAGGSINHVIAAGTGQNILNHESVRFIDGVQRVQGNVAAALAPMPNVAAQRAVISGLASQVAAVARVQGYSRAIVAERHGEVVANNATNQRIYGAQAGNALNRGTTANQALQHTLTAFQGPTTGARYQAYRDVLRMTFDSPGNLRVGDAYGNNLVSTGFDAPLTVHNRPEPRAFRLFAAHAAYAPNRLATPGRVFTTDNHGNVLSSSRHYGGGGFPVLPSSSLKRGRGSGPGASGGGGAASSPASSKVRVQTVGAMAVAKPVKGKG